MDVRICRGHSSHHPPFDRRDATTSKRIAGSKPKPPNDPPEVTLRAKPAGTQDTAKMREFMHYITNAFYGATGWNEDNTYKELNATARGMSYPPLSASVTSV